jgi:hypothetical protein
LGILFKDELNFISQNIELFLEKQPAVILAINSDTTIVSQMMAVRRMMHEATKYDEQQRQIERMSAVDPRSLIGGYVRQ